MKEEDHTALNLSKLSFKRGLGEPLASKFNPPDGTRFVGMACQNLNNYILFCSSSGRGFISSTKTISSKTKAGKNTLMLDPENTY